MKKHENWYRWFFVCSKTKIWMRHPWNSRDWWCHTFLPKKFFPKIDANYISFDSKLNADKSLQYNYGLKMLGSQDVRTVMTLGKLKCSDVLFCTYSKHQMLMLSEHQPALAENKPSFHVLKVKISWNASIFRPLCHCEV